MAISSQDSHQLIEKKKDPGPLKKVQAKTETGRNLNAIGMNPSPGT